MDITFRVLEGFDKGRVFRCISSPISIGREEGNSLQLNDERVSRFHAKVAEDRGDIVLMDLTSTNGTWVNGHPVKMRCLQPGDRIVVGKTTLLFGSTRQIRNATHQPGSPGPGSAEASDKHPEGGEEGPLNNLGQTVLVDLIPNGAVEDGRRESPLPPVAGNGNLGDKQMPPVPGQLSPSQTARLAEIFDHLHSSLSAAIRAKQTGDHNSVGMTLDFTATQKLFQVQMELARYLLAFVDPAVRDDLDGP